MKFHVFSYFAINFLANDTSYNGYCARCFYKIYRVPFSVYSIVKIHKLWIFLQGHASAHLAMFLAYGIA